MVAAVVVCGKQGIEGELLRGRVRRVVAR